MIIDDPTAYAWDQEVNQHNRLTRARVRLTAASPDRAKRIMREYNSARRGSETRRRLQPVVEGFMALRQAQKARRRGAVEAHRARSADFGEIIVRVTPTEMIIR